MIAVCIPCPQPVGRLEGTGNTPELTVMKISQAEIAKMHPAHESSSSIIPSIDYYHVELNKHGKNTALIFP